MQPFMIRRSGNMSSFTPNKEALLSWANLRSLPRLDRCDVSTHQSGYVPADSVSHGRVEAGQAAVHLAIDRVMEQEGCEVVVVEAAVGRVAGVERLVRRRERAVGLVEHLTEARQGPSKYAGAPVSSTFENAEHKHTQTSPRHQGMRAKRNYWRSSTNWKQCIRRMASRR